MDVAQAPLMIGAGDNFSTEGWSNGQVSTALQSSIHSQRAGSPGAGMADGRLGKHVSGLYVVEELIDPLTSKGI